MGGSGSCWGVRVDVNCEQRIEVFVKIQGKGGSVGGSVGGVRVGLGGQSGCERRIEVFVIIQKKNFFFGGGGGSGGQWEGSGWGGVRVDVNQELKFL